METPTLLPENQPALLPEPPSLEKKLFKQLIIIGVALMLTIVALVILCIQKPKGPPPPAPIITPQTFSTMIIASSAFENEKYIPAKYTCDGIDINPPLRFAEIPEGTLSFALIVDDPDATSGDWVHWLIWNIGVDITNINEDSSPAGAKVGLTDFGKNEWGGPCPSKGEHRYEFKLYALNTMLGIPENSTKADLLNAIQGHVIAEAKLTGLYSR